MINFEDDSYDHQLLQILDLLRKIDLDQFTTDLLVNDKKTFEELKQLMNEKGRVDVYKQK